MDRTHLYAERSAQVGELTAALSLAQGELRNAPRTQVGHFGKYADLGTLLDTIRGPFSKHGLSVTQEFLPYGEGWVVSTELAHKSGEWKRSVLPINHRLEPQKFAAAATYLKRIALSAIAGVAAEDDDDGETASKDAAVAKVVDDSRAEQMYRKSITVAKSPEELSVILSRVTARVKQGTLSQEAAGRLEEAAEQRIARAGGKKPAGGEEAKPEE
jgi:hypothetical protein